MCGDTVFSELIPGTWLTKVEFLSSSCFISRSYIDNLQFLYISAFISKMDTIACTLLPQSGLKSSATESTILQVLRRENKVTHNSHQEAVAIALCHSQTPRTLTRQACSIKPT